MNKTPYEIRLDVLKMAKEMLEEETRAKMLALETKNITLLNQNEWADNSSIIAAMANTVYTTADLTARASELYAFVNKRTSE